MTRPPITHVLKSWPDIFQDMIEHKKSFDLRFNDRDYRIGDYIDLREFNDMTNQFTGRAFYLEIVYVMKGIGPGGIRPYKGLQAGYVILGIKLP